MFENLSKKERIVLYIIIAFVTTLLLAMIHYFIQKWIVIAVFVIAVIEFLCIFYILYLPLKVKN
jgi:hypothetical protein